jgi:hypothetical protein
MRWRSISFAVFLANLGLFLATLFLYYGEAKSSPEPITRYEFIDLSLAVLNVCVALLAITLAVAAFWGYSAIREAATHKAAEVADRVARQSVQAYSEGDGAIALLETLLEQARRQTRSGSQKPDFNVEPAHRVRPPNKSRRPPKEGAGL